MKECCYLTTNRKIFLTCSKIDLGVPARKSGEQQHEGLTELAVVADMHSRKKMLYDMCDAAIILPGGIGTLDELFEMLTWNQLKIHEKNIYFLNSGGFYNYLLQHIKQMDKEGFLYEPWEQRVTFCNTPIEIFNRIE